MVPSLHHRLAIQCCVAQCYPRATDFSLFPFLPRLCFVNNHKAPQHPFWFVDSAAFYSLYNSHHFLHPLEVSCSFLPSESPSFQCVPTWLPIVWEHLGVCQGLCCLLAMFCTAHLQQSMWKDSCSPQSSTVAPSFVTSLSWNSPESIYLYCLPEVLAAHTATLWLGAECLQSLWPISTQYVLASGPYLRVDFWRNQAVIALPWLIQPHSCSQSWW